MSNAASVYTGVWTNYQHSSVEGSTLTLTSTNASYVVAFLALFLGVVAGHFWAILSYTVFQIRATLADRSAQHHQQQVILRNYHAPAAAIWQLFLASWSWRRSRGVRAFLPTLPVIILALTSIMAFAAAGILSAKITSKESDVLVKGADCGFWSTSNRLATGAVDSDALVAYGANFAEDMHLASTMAVACQKNSSVASDCVSYAPKQVEWTTTITRSCPFDPKMCYKNTTVRFDTGLLDTTEVFGINAQKSDRLLWRNVVECSPLVREGYYKDWHSMNGTKFRVGEGDEATLQSEPGEEWLELFYGPNLRVGINSTFFYSNRAPTTTMFGTQLWSLSAARTYNQWVPRDYVPIRSLNRTDADVNLLFMRQHMALEYSRPVNDPWFEANTPKINAYETQDGTYKNVTVYRPAFPISTVGCTHQFQWCDPSTGPSPTCTALDGLYPTNQQAKKLYKRKRQLTTLARIYNSIQRINAFSDIAGALVGSVLQMNKFGDHQLAPPKDDYWTTELSHMFGTLMKAIQIRNYRYTGGYSSLLDVKPVITQPMANETWMCDAQLVRREDYQSLSVLGLALICSLGTLIILINLSLDSIVGWYQKRYNKRVHATHEWDMLQAETMQEKLYAAYGVDLKEGSVSIRNVLEQLEHRKVGDTMETLVGTEKGLKSTSSTGSVAKGSVVDTSVGRVSTEGTSPVNLMASHA
ncbi:hypothetical protein CC86DRAFT_407618 [Ophiobolus disseminans]|uniref:Uncharacterized protein n=1 Tax=Ophiobolus disseminans TaxID=1469910 RepID=A0A6A6ZX42_9PLEO|nr:hypothetical protein CC86DRAFT_407618 [Ophiobolus disseminans]